MVNYSVQLSWLQSAGRRSLQVEFEPTQIPSEVSDTLEDAVVRLSA